MRKITDFNKEDNEILNDLLNLSYLRLMEIIRQLKPNKEVYIAFEGIPIFAKNHK